MENAILSFVHLCQKGKNSICKDPPYEGTSKSAEGHGAKIAFTALKEDGINTNIGIKVQTISIKVPSN